MTEWSLQDAKNRFSAVVDAALTGKPQRVTRRGKPAVVVLAVDEYERLRHAEKSKAPRLADLILAIPQDDESFGPPRFALPDPSTSDVPDRYRCAVGAAERKRNQEVVEWMAAQRTVDLYLCVVSIGEIERGIAGQQRRDPAFSRVLAAWVGERDHLVRRPYPERQLSTARRWGRLSHATGHQKRGLVVAATALEHGLTVVTCNVGDFEPTGVPVIDPSAPRK